MTATRPGPPGDDAPSATGELGEALRKALLQANPSLSRFDPLPRILAHDDFDRGYCGWSQLVGNYEGSVATMHPGYQQHVSPMLSTLGHWDAGSHGGMDGSYALKLATRPRAGAQNVAIKRLTFRKAGRIRFEAYVTFKPEATEAQLSETDVRAFGVFFDLQEGDSAGAGSERVMPHFRFLNATEGTHHQRWQFKTHAPAFQPLGDGTKTRTHYHMSPEGWIDLPGAEQRLCYNEIPTKVNWTYVRVDFDLATMRAERFICNDREHDVSSFESIRIPAMKNLWCMLNVAVFIEADIDKRAFLYMDAACLSAEA